jgi:nucleotide-binding universal stress UspA family protein
MKILISYDGSKCAEAALDDLNRAGLPEHGEALIVSVAEVWLPPPNIEPEVGQDETAEFIESIVETHRRKGELLLAEAEVSVGQAYERVERILPGWAIKTQATYGSPAWEVLSIAANFAPDLIITGSQGQSAISRLILGSVSQKIMTEAECSVRIARGRVEVEPSSTRIVIGFDGSSGAMAAVRSVAARNWPADTLVRLVTAADTLELPPDGTTSDKRWIAEFTSTAARLLEAKGLIVESAFIRGNPNSVLVDEAETWHADSIFVGANAHGSRLARFLLGTTSEAVAARAHCSVEVVRQAKAVVKV